jgi:hypothetical protein
MGKPEVWFQIETRVRKKNNRSDPPPRPRELAVRFAEEGGKHER